MKFIPKEKEKILPYVTYLFCLLIYIFIMFVKKNKLIIIDFFILSYFLGYDIHIKLSIN